MAGQFYPADPDRLWAEVQRLLAGSSPPADLAPKALIAPHAGYVYSGAVAAVAFAALRSVVGIDRQAIDKIADLPSGPLGMRLTPSSTRWKSSCHFCRPFYQHSRWCRSSSARRRRRTSPRCSANCGGPMRPLRVIRVASGALGGGRLSPDTCRKADVALRQFGADNRRHLCAIVRRRDFRLRHHPAGMARG